MRLRLTAAIACRPARRARPRRERRRGPDRHLPQRHGDDRPALPARSSSPGERCARRRLRRRAADRDRQTDQGMRLPHPGARAQPRDRRHRTPVEQHPEKPAAQDASSPSTLRAGGGARYQFAVYPLQRKAQLRKVLADGTIEYLRDRQERKSRQRDRRGEQAAPAARSTSTPAGANCRLLASVGGSGRRLHRRAAGDLPAAPPASRSARPRARTAR